MCEICDKVYCHPRCPNAPEPESIGACECCGEPIYVGDTYAKIDGEKYHKECLEELSVDEWLELIGVKVQEAE